MRLLFLGNCQMSHRQTLRLELWHRVYECDTSLPKLWDK